MFNSINKDIIGTIASLGCAIHCLALPMLILWFGMEDIGGAHHLLIDVSLLVLGCVIMAITVVPHIQSTKDAFLITTFIFGVVCFLISFFATEMAAHVLFGLGGISWAAAHVYRISTRSSTEVA